MSSRPSPTFSSGRWRSLDNRGPEDAMPVSARKGREQGSRSASSLLPLGTGHIDIFYREWPVPAERNAA